MSKRAVVHSVFGLAVVAASGCRSAPAPAGASPGYEVVAALDAAPGNITVGPDGTVVVSLHQFFQPDVRVATVQDGALVPFDAGVDLDAVLGVQFDPTGTLWLLDNGMRSGIDPRLIGVPPGGGAPRVIELGAVAPEDAFFNDLAVDADRGWVYIADPAGGPNAALVVVNLADASARRVLEGHESVTPENVDLLIDGQPVERKRPDGSTVRPHIGVNPIALSHDGATLYFGPMHGTTMYRVPTKVLRDASAPDAIPGAVEVHAPKPICDGISVDQAGNVYLGYLEKDAIAVLRPTGELEILARDPALSWIDAFAFGPDGLLYTVANQLHRVAPLNAGVDRTEPPFLVLRFTPLAPGVVGR